jgi:hypothetical protein
LKIKRCNISRKSKDRQYKGEKRTKRQWPAKHYIYKIRATRIP